MRLARLRIPLAPEEGWISVLLVAVMAMTVGWSLDDAGWVLGNSRLTDFLPLAAVLGVLAGFVGAKVGWNRLVAHLVGGAFAALIVPILVGQVLAPDAPPAVQFAKTAAATVTAWSDLVVHRLPATHQTGHHLLVIGLLCWATGQFAASAVFRHRRPLSAVVVIGTILIANMGATVRGQLGFMIIFSVASLFLLIRLHALDERTTWTRRRIGDPSAVSSIYLRGGTVFIAIAVVGSFVLTAAAHSSPLAGAWDDLKPWLLDVTNSIQRFLPNGGGSRSIGGVQFGPIATISNVWSPTDSLAMTIHRAPGDDRKYFWRAAAYDRFNGFGWEWTESTRTSLQPGDDLLAGTLDEPPVEGTQEVTFTVTPVDSIGSYIVSPLAPVSVDRNADVLGLGDEGLFEAVEVNGHEPYVVKARVPILGDAQGGLTQNLLRVAGTDYPKEIKARYLVRTPGAVGPEGTKILNAVLAKVGANPNRYDNPYDVALTMVEEFQSSRFVYDPDVVEEFSAQCGDRSVTECFALVKRGYCQHYASLMTVLLREHGIPARFVQGFLPGDLDPLTGLEQIQGASSHAWVEVYFPGHGWVSFDPTGGPSVGAAEAIPTGKPVASAPPTPSPSFSSGGPSDQEGPIRRSPGSGGGGVTSTGGPGAGGFIIISLILLAVVSLLAFLAWQRGPRGPTTPEGAYAGVARLAARFGFGPRPTQTAYEYATALGEILPNIRPELQTVATAKVEVAYGRRTLGDDRIRVLRESYRRLRVALLRLLFRRRERRR